MMMIEGPVADLRLVLALGMLGLATYWDLKTREISDYLWIAFGAASAVLILFTPNIGSALIGAGISLIVAPVVLLIWRFGLFGGADALGIIVLAALAPEFTLVSGVITPFTIITNSAILSTAPIIINVARNLISLARGQKIFSGLEGEPKGKKIIALFLGYRAKNPKFSFSIEKSEGSSKKFDFSPKNPDDAEFCSTPDTWVTPGLPYMIYIMSGFVIQLVYGDIIFHFIRIQH